MGHPLSLSGDLMSDVALPNDLRGRLISLWNAPVEKPRALLSLIAPGRDATVEWRHIADELGLQLSGSISIRW